MPSSGIMPRAMARIPAETEIRNNLEVDDKIVVSDGGKKDGSKRIRHECCESGHWPIAGFHCTTIHLHIRDGVRLIID